MTAANVGKIGAVVDPAAMVQNIVAECSEFALRHGGYCERGTTT
jgi:hypothetical protein